MAQEQLKTEELQSRVRDAVKSIDNPTEVLDRSLRQLERFGSFDLLESVMDAVQNVNPERKARKKIFLEEAAKKAERDALASTLQLWSEVLAGSDNIDELVSDCQKKTDQADQLLRKNLKTALDATRDLERSYRSVALFYKNSESTKVKNISIINADPDHLKDLDNPRFIEAIQDELAENFDTLDLRENYSLLILPGYLGSNTIVEKWAKIAYQNKVMLITDFQNLDAPDDVMELFAAANLTGGEIHRSNVMMTCNWLVGRGKAGEVGETEDLYVPPAAALGGKIYNTLMSQVAAGKKHGGINEVDGVRFDLRKNEIASLEKLGLVPIVKEFGKVMAFSAKTLFNGDNLGLQTYSIVRVFDYVSKAMMDFLNRRTFENFNSSIQRELHGQIVRFLDKITGPNKLIENFSEVKLTQDPKQKDRIYLDIHLKPFFPAKNFVIKLSGQDGKDAKEWDAEYAEAK